jgi:hypothetical protein
MLLKRAEIEKFAKIKQPTFLNISFRKPDFLRKYQNNPGQGLTCS